MKKIGPILIFILSLPLLLNSALTEYLKNEYIKVLGYPDEAGFIIKTTGGDPDLDTDKDSLLLYEDLTPTSFSTIFINGKGYIFGSDTGYFISRMMKRGDAILANWSTSNININVMQIIKIVNGPTTGKPDTVEIQYNIINQDGRNNNIGARIMLDTFLGEKDGVNFKTLRAGDIIEETALSKEQLPDYWFCYDDLTNPAIGAQGTIKIPDTVFPDKVIFSSWERFKKNLFDFTIKPGRIFRRPSGVFDSAVAVLWNERELKPNEGLTVKTYYGVAGPIEVYKGKIFDISLLIPVVEREKPFRLTAEIKNISPFEIKNVTAEIELPEELQLNGNEQKLKSIGDMVKAVTKDTFWSLIAKDTKKDHINFKVKVIGMVNNKKETEIIEGKIEFMKGPITIKSDVKEEDVEKKTGRFVYNFDWLNRIIKEVNEKKGTNNNKLDEINKLLEKHKKAVYTKKNGKEDRNKIDNRKKRVEELKEEIPEAAKSAIKYEEK